MASFVAGAVPDEFSARAGVVDAIAGGFAWARGGVETVWAAARGGFSSSSSWRTAA